MVEHSLFDENGKLKPVQSISFKKRAKDWWIKGFQLNRCYMNHWDEIKDIFEHYEVDLNRQGPIMTIQTLKYVRLAKKMTEKIKSNEEIRKLAGRCSFPTRTAYYADSDPDKIIDGIIFVTLLRVIPQFCMDWGLKKICAFMENGNSARHFKDLFSIEGGTIIETETDIERAVKKIIQELAENEKRN